MWIYVDDAGRVLGSNVSSMTGNTGWRSVSGNVPDELFNVEGVPLYKRSGNKVVARSAAEIAEDMPEAIAMPTDAQRISELEAQSVDVMDALIELGDLIGTGGDAPPVAD